MAGEITQSHPENKSVQVLYARILLELNRLEPAREAFVQLNQTFPMTPRFYCPWRYSTMKQAIN